MTQPQPRRRALAFLDKYEAKGRGRRRRQAPHPENDASECPDDKTMPQALVPVQKPEIIAPQTQHPASLLPDLPGREPIDLAPLEAALTDMMSTIDLAKPEGMIDTLFGRPDHRIEVKTERALRLARFKGALVDNIAEMRRAIEEVRALNRARHEQYLDNFTFQRQALEEQARLSYAQATAARHDAVEEAQTLALVAKYKAEAELAQRSALPPAPPPPAPTPVDEATRKREEAHRRVQDEIDTHLDEQAAWSAASEESVARAKARCIEIYRDLTMRDGEKRTRILRVLDKYNLDCSILPPAIEDLMTRAYEEVQE